MRFKLWLEIVDSFTPKSRMSRIVKNPGTVRAQPTVQFRWKTRLGNDVKVHFEERGEGTYNVLFYVNDTLYDDASKVEGSNRDVEILPGVFEIARQKADKLAASKLVFTAHKSDGDTKVVKGVDAAPRLQVVTRDLAQFEGLLRSYRPTMVEPSPMRAALFQKLGRPVPPAEPDFDVIPWIKWIAEVRDCLAKQDGFAMESLIDYLKSFAYENKFVKIGLDAKSLAENMEGLSAAFMSNSPYGWRRTVNRRAAIYTRLAQRYFGRGWTVSIQGDRFELTRNGSVA